MEPVFFAGLGGFVGAALRYFFTDIFGKWLGESFPYGTLSVNVAGAFLIGLIMTLSLDVWPIPGNLRIFLTTGILGGLTTFSTFSYETIMMFQAGNYGLGAINAGLNLFLSLVGVILGQWAAKLI